MRRPLLALALLAFTMHPAPGGAQTRGRAAGGAPSPAAARVGPAMPAVLVAQLVERGKQGSIFPDITRRSGLTGTNLAVTSNRLLIARASAAAVATGAAYAPPAELRRDEVTVTCVDTRQRFAVDCERVVVLINERATPALRSTSGPRTLTNDRGATWQVGGADAVYPAGVLKDGFVVTGLARGGQSWTLIVTAEEAAERLLLGAFAGAR